MPTFVTAVTTAIAGRADLSFNAGTGTLTYTGTGSPMQDLVINLAADQRRPGGGPRTIHGQPVEPGQHHRLQRVVGSGLVTTIINDANAATWSLSGSPSVAEGNAA